MYYKVLDLTQISYNDLPSAKIEVLDEWKFDFNQSMYGDQEIIQDVEQLDDFMDCFHKGIVSLQEEMIEKIKEVYYFSDWFKQTINFEGKRMFMSIENELNEEIMNIDTKKKLREVKSNLICDIQSSLDEEDTQIYFLD